MPIAGIRPKLFAICVLVICGIGVHANEPETNFLEFWKHFRAAVLERKWEQIQSCTEFPLKTHGELDWSPQGEVTESKFQRLFEKFLAQRVFVTKADGQLAQLSLEEQIRNLVSPPKEEPSSRNWARVEDMQFRRTTGGWKLYLLYLDEE